MLRNLLIFSGLMALVAMELPAYIETEAAGSAERTLVAEDVDARSAAAAPATPGGRREYLMRQDLRGHFSGTFQINGKPVEGMIDTGASVVALPESVARRLGFNAATLTFDHQLNTANGKTFGARIRLDRMDIGPVRVRDVQAVVLRDEALSSPLIGMSFLRKLSGFAVADGRMKLIN